MTAGARSEAIETELRKNMDGTVNTKYRDTRRGTRPVVRQEAGTMRQRSSAGSTEKRAATMPITCRARRNGSTRAGRYHYRVPWGNELNYDHGNFGKRGHELGGCGRGTDVWVDENLSVARFRPNAWGCMTCTATSSSGHRIAFRQISRMLPSMADRIPKATAQCACSGRARS